MPHPAVNPVDTVPPAQLVAAMGRALALVLVLDAFGLLPPRHSAIARDILRQAGYGPEQVAAEVAEVLVQRAGRAH